MSESFANLLRILPSDIKRTVLPILFAFVVTVSANAQNREQDSLRSYFALKTNLLFDVASILNVEVEVPVARHWSVMGEWTFPWWSLNKKQHNLEILSGHIEGRYWFNKKEPRNHNPMVGWFVGLYGGTGIYDVEWDRKGYQGDWFLSGGISAGYSHALSKTWRLEFAVSAGYLQSDYKLYDAQYSNVDKNWHLIWQHDGTFKWIGPTKAKISIVWYPQFKKKGGKR